MVKIFDMLIAGYVLLVVASLLSGCFLFVLEKKPKTLKYISIFGGAFLLAVCFVHLLPEAFSEGAGHCGHSAHGMLQETEHFCSSHSHEHEHAHSTGFPLGGFVLLGFLLQLLLELLSKGAEHGHLHKDDHSAHRSDYAAALMVLLGVSIHAFLEGFALVSDGRMNYSLLFGVVLHNIPISMIVMSGFLKAGCSKGVSLAHLFVFAIMGVAGSLLSSQIATLQEHSAQIMCFVVGILLHVCVSTLFDSTESHRYNFVRFAIVITAFAIACLLPH